MSGYGDIFAAWRAAAGETWTAYTHHPFVTALGDGTLPRAAYLHYLKQDYIFLLHFSRAWALAVTKADTADEMRFAARTMDGLLNGELALHIETCAREGISEAELQDAEERAENLAYTRYVLDAGYSGDFLDLLAALAPCVLGYGEIGTRLNAEATSGQYREWIDTYAGDDMQGMCRDVGVLIDAAAARRLGDDPQGNPRWQSLCKRFATATRLEVGFWDMGLDP